MAGKGSSGTLLAGLTGGFRVILRFLFRGIGLLFLFLFLGVCRDLGTFLELVETFCYDKLSRLKNELPGMITKVQGTGLLFSCELAPQFKCFGADSTEEWMREHGIGVIHGGVNSLRFTPHFGITTAEVDLMVDGVKQALLHGPRKQVSKPEAVAA